MIAGRLIKKKDGTVKMLGVDHGGPGKVLKETKKHIAVKWPRHCWNGRGFPRAYAPARTAVYEIRELEDDGCIRVLGLIEWDNRR